MENDKEPYKFLSVGKEQEKETPRTIDALEELTSDTEVGDTSDEN